MSHVATMGRLDPQFMNIKAGISIRDNIGDPYKETFITGGNIQMAPSRLSFKQYNEIKSNLNFSRSTSKLLDSYRTSTLFGDSNSISKI